MSTAQHHERTPTTPSARAAESQESARLQALTADISARLRRVCGHLSNEEFADLVLDVAQVRLRYEDIALTGLAPRPKLERSD